MAIKVGIVGIGHTRFGNSSEYDLADVMAYAATNALEDAGFLERRREIDQVIVGNMASGMFCHQSAVASSLVSRMDMEPVPAELVENGPASGASAIKIGYMAVASGMADIVLVVGGEIMRKVSGWNATDVVATMLETEAEYNMGLTLPAFGGMFTRLYMERYGRTERDLALVAVQNHKNGAKNKYAHIQAPCTIEACFSAKIIDPLCPWNEGIWRFESHNSRLHVEKTSNADCELTIQGLSALVAGTHDPQDFPLAGWGDPDNDLQSVQREMFPAARPYLHENF